jgi:hypothetical protein
MLRHRAGYTFAGSTAQASGAGIGGHEASSDSSSCHEMPVSQSEASGSIAPNA